MTRKSFIASLFVAPFVKPLSKLAAKPKPFRVPELRAFCNDWIRFIEQHTGRLTAHEIKAVNAYYGNTPFPKDYWSIKDAPAGSVVEGRDGNHWVLGESYKA